MGHSTEGQPIVRELRRIGTLAALSAIQACSPGEHHSAARLGSALHRDLVHARSIGSVPGSGSAVSSLSASESIQAMCRSCLTGAALSWCTEKAVSARV